MRSAKDLKDLVDNCLSINGGGAMPLTIVTEDEAESRAIWDLLKGRRGGKSITLRVCKHPDEFLPIPVLLERRAARKAKPEPAPAVVDDLDYDGY